MRKNEMKEECPKDGRYGRAGGRRGPETLQGATVVG